MNVADWERRRVETFNDLIYELSGDTQAALFRLDREVPPLVDDSRVCPFCGRGFLLASSKRRHVVNSCSFFVRSRGPDGRYAKTGDDKKVAA